MLKKIIWQYELVQHLLPVGLNFPYGAGSIKVWEDDTGVGNDDVCDVDVNDDAYGDDEDNFGRSGDCIAL